MNIRRTKEEHAQELDHISDTLSRRMGPQYYRLKISWDAVSERFLVSGQGWSMLLGSVLQVERFLRNHYRQHGGLRWKAKPNTKQ